MEPKFDFSKQEDQDKFDKLPQEDKDKHIEHSQEKAELINELTKLLSADEIIDLIELLSIKKELEEKFPQEFQEIIQLPEIQQAALERMHSTLSMGFIEDAVDIQEYFSISKEKFQEVVLEGVKVNILKGAPVIAKEIQEDFSIPQEIFEQTVIEAIKEMFNNVNIDVAIRKLKHVLEELSIPETKLEQIAGEVSKPYFEKGDVQTTLKILEAFMVQENENNTEK